MIVGFTGTRNSLDYFQIKRIKDFLKENKDDIEYCIAGLCVGADEVFFKAAKSEGLKTVAYPGFSKKNPKDKRYRSSFKPDVTHEEKPYLDRNKIIVNECDVLIACPSGTDQKGGTWYTVNFAKKVKKKTVLFLPEGEINA